MQIILASQNKNKLKELSTVFQKKLSKHSLVFPNKVLNVIEDKETIKENAEKKALEYFKFYDLPVIADDSGGTGSGSSTFTGLTDTPINFTGSQGKVLAVNSNEDALEFVDASTNSTTFSGLTDTPTNFTGSQGRLLSVNSAENAVEFVEDQSFINSIIFG